MNASKILQRGKCMKFMANLQKFFVFLKLTLLIETDPLLNIDFPSTKKCWFTCHFWNVFEQIKFHVETWSLKKQLDNQETCISWLPPKTYWKDCKLIKTYNLKDRENPGGIGCGNCHFWKIQHVGTVTATLAQNSNTKSAPRERCQLDTLASASGTGSEAGGTGSGKATKGVKTGAPVECLWGTLRPSSPDPTLHRQVTALLLPWQETGRLFKI